VVLRGDKNDIEDVRICLSHQIGVVVGRTDIIKVDITVFNVATIFKHKSRNNLNFSINCI
jgi:serine acetyltransferase